MEKMQAFKGNISNVRVISSICFTFKANDEDYKFKLNPKSKTIFCIISNATKKIINFSFPNIIELKKESLFDNLSLRLILKTISFCFRRSSIIFEKEDKIIKLKLFSSDNAKSANLIFKQSTGLKSTSSTNDFGLKELNEEKKNFEEDLDVTI
jgi:hypothetical protein